VETELASLSRRYQAALGKHLDQEIRASPQSADRLGRAALDMGLDTLDLAKIHEQALDALVSSRRSSGITDGSLKRAQTFFARTLIRIEKTHGAAVEANSKLKQVNQSLRERTKELASKNRQLKKEIAERRTAEKTLKKSEGNYAVLLEQSRCMQEQLQHLSRQILCVQEEERRRISRELHDEITQVMTGINLHLASWKKESTRSVKDFRRKITHTQRLVEKSVNAVREFASQLRPPALDDLGLFPTLHAYIKDFAQQTGLAIHFMSFTRNRIDRLDNTKRIVLYRVAQESLANVAKHADADRVTVSLQKQRGLVRMEIKDDGQSFPVHDTLSSKRNKGLGLLSMRERVEMVGGCLTVESIPSRGTMIRADIPLANGRSENGSCIRPRW
jgi:signal transduction histidine kinase